MLVIFFLIWYILEFLIRWIYCFNFTQAYKNISFEVEAYDNENNLDYIQSRKKYSWLKCL